ncbi:MAG: hypothetical protein AB7V50_01390 [Vampirovibrionia bacterium]
MPDQKSYPRMTLKCDCGNEFNVNVMRMKEQTPVFCMICGEVFPADIGVLLAQAFEDLFKAKYLLEKDSVKFKYSFVYKSTFNQPPAPFPLGETVEEEKAEEKKVL